MMRHPRVQVSDSALDRETVAFATVFLFNVCISGKNEGPPKSSFLKGGFRRNVNIKSQRDAAASPSSSLGFSSGEGNGSICYRFSFYTWGGQNEPQHPLLTSFSIYIWAAITILHYFYWISQDNSIYL